MPRVLSLSTLVASSFLLTSCSADDPNACGTDDALLACTTPQFSADYYIAQGEAYFDTFDTRFDNTPIYSANVVRWEWPPWLKLTALGQDFIEMADPLVQQVTPSTVPVRDCRYFEQQPFVRCRISFMYSSGPCPIYEEFSFNDAGEMTWIEAWADQPGMLPFEDPDDLWGEGPNVSRMATLIPGLGTPTGEFDPNGEAMILVAESNVDVADFRDRAQSPTAFTFAWLQEFAALGSMSEFDIYGEGCGWEAPTP